MRLAPLALLAAGLASAQNVEVNTTGTGGSNSAATAVGTAGGIASPNLTGGTLSGPSLTGGINSVGPVPTFNPALGNGAAVTNPGFKPAAVTGVVPGKGPVLNTATVAPATVIPGKPGAQKSATPSAPSALEQTHPAAFVSGAHDASGAPTANTVLDGAVKGVELGKRNESAGVDGLTVRQALDRAYDATMRGGDVVAANGGVAGKFQSTKERIANMLTVANTAPPANAPELYEAVRKDAQESLPKSVAAAVAKTVLAFAGKKADASLTELAQAAFEAAAAGQTSETARLLKSIDKWESLLGAPGKPLISNGAALKDGVSSALEAAKSGSKKSPPRVWLEKRGGSFVAALPGSPVQKVPGLGASFALKLETLSASPLAGAYRAFVASPGASTVYRARRALGDSVPSAGFTSATFWLKSLLMRVWLALRSFLPGRSLPSVATEANMPRLREAAKAWTDAAGLGDAAARMASSPRLTVSRARGAFALAMRSAAAHEVLTGESGAVATVAALAADFESAAKAGALSGSDALTPGLAALLSGDGGLAHWASRHAADARERGAEAFAKVKGESAVVVLGAGPAEAAAKSLAAAAKGMSVTAYGSALWARGSGPHGRVLLSADLRSTESGGSVSIETAGGDERLARALDALGFSVVRKGAGLKAVYDADTASADAAELAAVAAEASALVSGAEVRTAPSFGGLQRLLADLKTAKGDAAKTAKALDGRAWLSRAKPIALVGDLHAYSVGIPSHDGNLVVTALRDPETGLTQYARAERPDGKLVPPAAFAELLRAR